MSWLSSSSSSSSSSSLGHRWRLVCLFIVVILLDDLTKAGAISCAEKGITVSENLFPTDLTSGPTFQYTSSAILMVTKNFGFSKSYDNGQSWEDQLPFLANSDVIYPGYSNSGVRYIISPEVDQDTLYVVGFGPIWVTKNGGKTYSIIEYFTNDFSPVNLQDIQVSPSSANTIAISATSTNTGTKSLYLSTNYGLGSNKDGGGWSVLDINVLWFLWTSDSISPKTILYTQCPAGLTVPYTCRLVKGTDNGQSRTTLLNNAGMALSNGYEVVAAQYADASMQEVKLFLSHDLNSWKSLLFPAPVKAKTWRLWQVNSPNTTWITIDTTGVNNVTCGDLYINVNHNNKNNNQSVIMMSLSLPNIFPQRVNIVKQSSTAVAYVTAYDGKPSSTTSKVTMMSYDRGGTWNRIQTSLSCSASSCPLNIYDLSPTSRVQAGAPGVLLTDGNLGPFLSTSSSDLKTFASVDFGNSWKQFSSYPSEFAFAGGGSLAVWTRNDQPTQSLSYSWALNSGDLTSCDFTSDPFMVGDIISGDDDGQVDGTSVLIWGKRYTNGMPQLVLVSVDFSSYPINRCLNPNIPDSAESDYETITADDPVNGKCVMGQSIVYQRKKVTSSCYDPHDYNTVSSVKVCPCTEEDYECDYCYERNEDGKCVLQDGCSKLSIRTLCTNGYAIIPDDVCDDNSGLNKIPSCSAIGGVVAGVTFLIIVLATVSFLYYKNDRFRDYVKSFGRNSSSTTTTQSSYSRLDVTFPGGDAPEEDNDDEHDF